MRFVSLMAVAVASAFVLAAPRNAPAATPPNPNDPCAAAGWNQCGTAGVGFYAQSKYGARWYGDFRRAVRGEPHTFCIDLRFWYASPSYGYRERSSALLRNRAGAPVPAAKQAEMAYAIWKYGRSTNPKRQAAVMLHVHSLMGDARRGELDAALGPRVASIYREIASASGRFHGPYRIETRFSPGLTVGQTATATIRLLSGRGYALPGVRLTLTGEGADGIARTVQTSGGGVVTISLTPTDGQVQLRVQSEPVAANSPRIFVPTTATAAPNGQRLAAPDSQRVAATVSVPARPLVSAQLTQRIVRPGSPVLDRIRVQGLGTTSTQVELTVFGPFASRALAHCNGKPYAVRRLTIHEEGSTPSPAVRLAAPGFYTYRVGELGETSTVECAETSTTVLAAPKIVAGRGEVAAFVRGASAQGSTPTEVRVPSLRLRVPVVPAGIDVRHGVLGIPTSIRRAGWWADGMAPGASSGAILIAGHVDSAQAGAGAFFRLQRAREGERVRLSTADGRTFVYRVVSVRSYAKSALPMSVYSSSGAPRLVLVTCGGPFDAARGHYRDNIVVTAVPA